jgi:arylsulfatase A
MRKDDERVSLQARRDRGRDNVPMPIPNHVAFRAQPAMVRSTLLLAMVLVVLICPFSVPRADAAAQANRPPNIVLIFCDDLGISNIGYHGADAPFRTPHIDALANQSLRFDRAFSAPICGPSRAQVLTGQYGFRSGVVDNATAAKLNPAEDLVMPQVMRKAGYKTAGAGKWSQLEYLTTKEDGDRWGFDDFLLWTGFGTHDRYWAPRFNHNGNVRTWDDKTYGPDVLQQFVVDFMAKHKEEPFFVYYAHPLPHGPRTHTPDSKSSKIDGREMYADQVAYLDKQVGLLVKDLERLGLRENTLILFTSDNGAVYNESIRKGGGGGTIRGRWLDGGKGSAGEGACRVPMFVSWPAVIREGRVSDDLINLADLLPTFCELAAARLPSDYVHDGRSFAPQLRGQKGTPREWVYAGLHRGQDPIHWVRDDGWRLTGNGVLTAVHNAPFGDVHVNDSEPKAKAARERLQKVLDGLK